MNRQFVIAVFTTVGILFCSGQTRLEAQRSTPFFARIEQSTTPAMRVAASSQQVMSARWSRPQVEQTGLRVQGERLRGTASEVYANAAPKVVLVRSGNGYGSGFLVQPRGWVLTNFHVIRDAGVDTENGAAIAFIHSGSLDEHLMHLQRRALLAHVFLVDEEKDLALLKIVDSPELPATKPIALAKQAPPPGAACLAIGHPHAGMLWSLRTGTVSRTGSWPADRLDTVMQSLIASPGERRALEAILAAGPRRKVLLSTCTLGAGDSGGPLLNEQGELIAVAFGVPTASDADAPAGLAYHVHLDEVKAFLQRAESLFEAASVSPPAYVPDPWPPGLYTRLEDFDEDGHPDSLLYAADPAAGLTGVLLDLDQDSVVADCRQAIDEGSQPPWDFEVALHAVPYNRALIDTNSDGELDMLLIDEDLDERAEVVLAKVQGAWQVASRKDVRLVDPALLKDRGARQRLATILRNVQQPTGGTP